MISTVISNKTDIKLIIIYYLKYSEKYIYKICWVSRMVEKTKNNWEVN